MKSLQQFQYDICHTVYNSKDECLKCEKSHSLPKKIADMRINSYKSNGEYPATIDVEMSDGTIQRYKR